MLPEVKNILLLTDFSQNAWHAFKYAVALGQEHKAVVHIMHVLPELPKELQYSGGSNLLYGFYGTGPVAIPHDAERTSTQTRDKDKERAQAIQKAEEKARDNIKTWCSKLKNEVPAVKVKSENIVVNMGPPVETILEELKSGSYDLAVMGRRGHGRLRGPRTGGVANAIAARSNIPVLIVGKPK